MNKLSKLAKAADSFAQLNATNEVAIDLIDVLPQVRTNFDPKLLAELAESIAENGQIQAILIVLSWYAASGDCALVLT